METQHDQVAETADVRALGNMTKTVSAEPEKQRQQNGRRLLWLMREAAGELTGGRVQQCGRRLINAEVGAIVRMEAGRAWIAGVRQCGNVHTCPVCSSRVGSVRAEEIRQGLTAALEAGYHVTAVVPTVRHARTDDLKTLLQQLKAGWRNVFSGRAGQNLRQRLGVVGSIRADEVTYGNATGWHPHMHIVLITRDPLDDDDGRALYERFAAGVARAGGETTLGAWSGGLQKVSSGGLADYLCKLETLKDPEAWTIAEEVALANRKRAGRRLGDRERWSPWQLLQEFAETGDMLFGDLFRKYADAFAGTRRVQWSPGLKKELGVNEVTDEEAAQDEATDGEAEIIGTMTAQEWREVVTRDIRIELLEWIEDGYSLDRFLSEHWIRRQTTPSTSAHHAGTRSDGG